MVEISFALFTNFCLFITNFFFTNDTRKLTRTSCAPQITGFNSIDIIISDFPSNYIALMIWIVEFFLFTPGTLFLTTQFTFMCAIFTIIHILCAAILDTNSMALTKVFFATRTTHNSIVISTSATLILSHIFICFLIYF